MRCAEGLKKQPGKARLKSAFFFCLNRLGNAIVHAQGYLPLDWRIQSSWTNTITIKVNTSQYLIALMRILPFFMKKNIPWHLFSSVWAWRCPVAEDPRSRGRHRKRLRRNLRHRKRLSQPRRGRDPTRAPFALQAGGRGQRMPRENSHESPVTNKNQLSSFEIPRGSYNRDSLPRKLVFLPR